MRDLKIFTLAIICFLIDGGRALDFRRSHHFVQQNKLTARQTDDSQSGNDGYYYPKPEYGLPEPSSDAPNTTDYNSEEIVDDEISGTEATTTNEVSVDGLVVQPLFQRFVYVSVPSAGKFILKPDIEIVKQPVYLQAFSIQKVDV